MTSVPGSGVSYLDMAMARESSGACRIALNPTTWTAYLFSGSRDIAEYDNGAAVNQPSRKFIYSGGVPGSGLLASVTSGSTLTYFHSDHLGWRASTNASGQVVGQQGQYPYGESWYSQNGNEFMFTSYQYDTQSALYYAIASTMTAARAASVWPTRSAEIPRTRSRGTAILTSGTTPLTSQTPADRKDFGVGCLTYFDI